MHTNIMLDPGEYSFLTTAKNYEKRIEGVTVALTATGGAPFISMTQSSVSFDDMTGHWAQKTVELLASKLVLQGVSQASFAPARAVTRAEFAAMLPHVLKQQRYWTNCC